MSLNGQFKHGLVCYTNYPEHHWFSLIFVLFILPYCTSISYRVATQLLFFCLEPCISGYLKYICVQVFVLFPILQEGKLEAEEFTEQLYRELKSTPQPCLVPFLKVTAVSTTHIIIINIFLHSTLQVVKNMLMKRCILTALLHISLNLLFHANCTICHCLK